jgi:hypothetical protein
MPLSNSKSPFSTDMRIPVLGTSRLKQVKVGNMAQFEQIRNYQPTR